MTEQWFYAKGDRREGPFTFDQLKWLAGNTRLQRTDFVWREGMAEWLPAGEVAGLFTSQATPIQPPPSPRSVGGSQQAVRRPPSHDPIASASQPPVPRQIKFDTQPAPSADSASPSKGTVVVCRKPTMKGLFYKMTLTADGKPVGEIPGGLLDLLAGRKRELEFHLRAGARSLEVTGGGLKGSATVCVQSDRAINLVTYFSTLGVLGGELVITEVGVVEVNVHSRLRGSKVVIATCVVSVAAIALYCGVGSFLSLGDNNSKRPSLADSSAPEALHRFFENALTSVAVVNEIPGLPQPTTGPNGEPLLKKKETLTNGRIVRLEYTCFYQGGDPDMDLLHGYCRSWYKNGRVNQLIFYNNGQFTAEMWWESDGLSRDVVMRDRAGYYHMAVVDMRLNGGRESTRKAISATNRTVGGTGSIKWLSEEVITYHINGAPWRVSRWQHGRPIDNITYNADGSLDGSVFQFIDGTFYDRGMAPLHVR